MLNHRFRFYLRIWKLPGKDFLSRLRLQTLIQHHLLPVRGIFSHIIPKARHEDRRSKHLFASILPDPTVRDRPWASKYVQWTRNMIRDPRINRVMPTPDAGTLPLCTQTLTHTPSTAPMPLLALTSLCWNLGSLVMKAAPDWRANKA